MSDALCETPATIGPFNVIRPLAKGGMAAVFEVEDPATGRRVALKLLTQRGLARPRFDREYRSLTRLDHPNIVRVYQFGITDSGERYLTMEVVEGEAAQVHAKSLGRPGTPARTGRVLHVVREVALALAYLHDRGLVHRDLKSSNVLVLADGGVKLLDFGTARLLDPDDEITRHGEFVGTFAYASPEQLRGEQVDTRTDLYALGVLFYRLLTGKRPFEGDNPHALARLHLEHVPAAPDQVVAGVPPDAAALVMRLLEKDASGRPATAWVVVDALDRLLGEAGADPVSPSDLCVPELVGREAEVGRLRAFLDDPTAGRVLLVSGREGAGRDRVLSQVEADARRRGQATFSARFPGGGGVGALAALAREIARGLPRAPGRLSDPDLSCILRAAGPTTDRAVPGVVSALSSLIRRRQEANGNGLILMLRDVHRTPPLARSVLAGVQAEAAREGQQVAIVGTVLAGSMPPESLQSGAVCLTLRALAPVDVGRLVGAVLGRRAPPPSLASRLHAATGGLPGDVVEVLHAMVQEGLVVARREGPARVVWRDRSGGRLAVPASIRDRLLLQIDALSRPERRLLEAAAIAQMPLRAAALAAAVESPPAEVVEDISQLASRGLLRRSDDGWVPDTGLLGQLVRERVGGARRVHFQQRLAAAVGGAEVGPGKLRLLLGAGHLRAAAEAAVMWAPEAIADHRAASVAPVLLRVQQAVEADPPDDIPPGIRVRLTIAALTTSAVVRPTTRAELAALSSLPVPDPLRAAVDLAEARLRRTMGDPAGGGAALGRARGRLRRHPDQATALAVDLEQGHMLALSGDPAGALLAFQAAGRAADVLGSRVAHEDAGVGEALARYALGELDEAESLLEMVRQAASARAGVAAGLHAGVHLVEVLRVCGRHTEALSVLDAGLDHARVAARPHLHAAALQARAAISLDLFRLGEVRDLLAEAEGIDVAALDPWLRGEGARLRGRLHLAAGEFTQAVAILEPALEQAASAGLALLEARTAAWLGEACAMAGDGVAARAAHERAASLLVEHRHTPIQAEVCGRRAFGGEPDGAHAPVEAWLAGAPARLARLERAIASLSKTDACSRVVASTLVDAAEAALADFAALLGPREASALRVHPWRVQVDRLTARFRVE
ncbi:MAG: protein kinase [Myxococcota bacterium]|nr:protein kinase [Myxococcota bacterium]